MSKSRKLPLVAAVNIDGRSSRRIPREGNTWSIDKRIPVASQIDNVLYKNNVFDRGHMVRREDPVWGTATIAAQANEDTFHYTNAAPQHEQLNQQTWLSLEDYVLDNARARDLKVSVFNGPIFRATDRVYRGVKIPEEYWKVAAVVNTDTGKLSATGYVLSQGALIHDLTESWVYGEFRTYQVSLATIEQATGLDFGALKPFDPLGTPIIEGVEPAKTFIPVDGPESILFTR
jgi:endonuclease G